MINSPSAEPSTLSSGRSDHLLGLSLGFICTSWVFFLHVYLPPAKPTIPWTMVGLAFILLAVRAYFTNREVWIPAFTGIKGKKSWVPYAGMVTCGLALLVFPYPYNLGAAFLGFGWLLSTLTSLTLLSGNNRQKAKHSGTPIIRPLAEASAQTGLLLSVTAILLPLVFAWAARTHQFEGPGQLFAYPVGWLLQLFGLPVEFVPGGTLLLRTFEDAAPFTITAEKLFPVPMVLFALVWSGIILLRKSQSRWESLGVFWLVFLAYSMLRAVVLILIFIQRNNPSYFWEPWVIGLSLLPLGFLLKEPAHQIIANPSADRKQTPGKRAINAGLKNKPHSDLLRLALGFVCGAAIIAGFTFRDPGSPKAGKITINEHGSDWEGSTDTLNTEKYSEITTYNYYCLAQFLNYYYDLIVNQEPLSPKTLAGTDVLILKIPTQPYTADEIQAVVEYVRQGGSLWVIGDHTNVFGSSSFFNSLLRRFGYSLNYVSTHDMASGNLSLFEKPARFAHPTVLNLPTYLFATSCSMNAPWSAEAAILGYGLRADHLDYSQKNFFADRNRNQFNIEFGLMLQQAAGTYGRGRILVTTDSTPFSNFFIFIKGKPELALGTLDWLNRNPKLSWINTILLIAGISGLIAAVVFQLWGGASLVGIILGLSLVGLVTDEAARRAYPLPQPIRPIPWLNFEREHSQYFLPVLRLVKDGDPDYLTFYVWTQRVGAVPREWDSFEQAVSGNDPVVMMDPATPLSPAETAALRRYLENGGRLLLMNSVQVGCGIADGILAPYSLRLKGEMTPSDTLHTLTIGGRFFPLVVKGEFAHLQGGQVFLKSDQGEAIGVLKTVGKGKIWALSCGHLFRNNYFGQTSTIPDDGLRALYQVEFDIVKEMLQN